MNRTNKILAAFVAGAAAGTIATMLLAPGKGSDTRKKIAAKLKEKYSGYKEKCREMKETADEAMN